MAKTPQPGPRPIGLMVGLGLLGLGLMVVLVVVLWSLRSPASFRRRPEVHGERPVVPRATTTLGPSPGR
jgi:hypothetical protein